MKGQRRGRPAHRLPARERRDQRRSADVARLQGSTEERRASVLTVPDAPTDDSQHRYYEAHTQAAESHERAAMMHDEIAARYEALSLRERAAEERALGAEQRQKARRAREEAQLHLRSGDTNPPSG